MATEDSQPAIKGAGDLSPVELLEAIPRLAAAVISLSVVLGVASLMGKSIALGMSGTEFLTLPDLANEAIRVAPLAVLGAFTTSFYYLAIGDAVPESTPKRTLHHYYGRFGLLMSVTLLIFWTVQPTLAAGLILALVFFVLRTLLTIGQLKVRAGAAPWWTVPLGAMVSVTILFFLFAHWTMTNKVLDNGSRQPEATHRICTEKECRQGIMLARFSDTTAVRWVPGIAVSYIPNDDIGEVTALLPREDVAVYPIWTWLRKLLERN